MDSAENTGIFQAMAHLKTLEAAAAREVCQILCKWANTQNVLAGKIYVQMK